MNLKVLVVILLLLVLCLGSGITLGAAGDEDRGIIGGSWTAGLRDLLARGQTLSIDDISGGTPLVCRRQFREGTLQLASGETCTLEIRSSSAPSRQVRLRLTAGTQAQAVMLHNAPDRLAGRYNIKLGQEVSLYVYKEGGRLRVSCLASGSGTGCVLRVR